MKIIKHAYAQASSVEYDFDPGPFGVGFSGNPGQVFTKVISTIVGVMTICGLLWFMIQIVTAGYNFIQSGGDSQKLKQAQQKIQNNFIGAVIVIAAIFLFSLVGELLGIPNILDLESIINNIAP